MTVHRHKIIFGGGVRAGLFAGTLLALFLLVPAAARSQLLSSDDLVQTPAGLIPSSCITEVPNGAVIGPDGVVSLADEVVGTSNTCSAAAFFASQPEALSGPGTSGWATGVYFDAGSTVQYQAVTAHWVVPPLPPDAGAVPSYSACVYLWLGMQIPSGASQGLIQPVIGVNCHNDVFTPTPNQWYMDVAYLGTFPDGGYGFFNPAPKKVYPGDEIYGNIYPTPSTGNDFYEVYVADLTSGHQGSVYENAWTPASSWSVVLPAILEVAPGGTSYCAELPSSEIADFFDISVQAQKGGASWGTDVTITDGGVLIPTLAFYSAGPVTPYCYYTADAWYGLYSGTNWGGYDVSLGWNPDPPGGAYVWAPPAGTSVAGYAAADGGYNRAAPGCFAGEELWNRDATCYYAAGQGSAACSGGQNDYWDCITGSCSGGVCATQAACTACGTNSDCYSASFECWQPTQVCLVRPGYTCNSNSNCMSGNCVGTNPGICATSTAGQGCQQNSDCATGLTCDNRGSTNQQVLPGPFTSWTCH